MSDLEKPKPAVMLWAVPRSLSTSIFRAFESAPNTKVFLEPFENAYYFGEERVSERYCTTPIRENLKYSDVQNLLEDSVSNNHLAFAKDMAFFIVQGKKTTANILQTLPKGYKHTFLYRDPYKSIYSYYKMSTCPALTGWNYFDGKCCGFKELWKLYEIVRDNIDPHPLVINADDFIIHPRKYLQHFCRNIGFEFHESMIRWNDGSTSIANQHEHPGWFTEALLSTRFHEPVRPALHAKQRTYSIDLPSSVHSCIENNMKYFDLLESVKFVIDDEF